MTAVQRVCWALAQECRNDDLLIVGVATPIAAAAAFIARDLLVPDLTIIVGGAVDPVTMDVAQLIVDPLAACRTASAIFGQRELLPLLQRGSITLQFVSPAQVDVTGALNTSRVFVNGQWRRLPGCLALPDTAAMVGRLVAYRVEGGDRFIVDQVDHITGIGRVADFRASQMLPGRGVVAVVTDNGRSEVRDQGLTAPVALEEMPAEALELLSRSIDTHGVLGIESRSERAAARTALNTVAENALL